MLDLMQFELGRQQGLNEMRDFVEALKREAVRQVAQAREAGRVAGLLQAADICDQRAADWQVYGGRVHAEELAAKIRGAIR